MPKNDRRERVNRNENVNPPEFGHEPGHGDHHPGTREAEDEGELELLHDLGHLLEEGRVFGFFAGGAPRHVDAEHVRQDGLGDVQADAAEEDHKERDPGEVLEQRG